MKSKSPLLVIPFGATLMVQGDKLNFWLTDYDTLDITQIQLSNLVDTPIKTNKKIDLLNFSLGHNKIDTGLDLNDFVTYVRKESLKYDQDYYEKFVLVFINKDDINILPFDWFNKTGGDYGYVWPATNLTKKEINYMDTECGWEILLLTLTRPAYNRHFCANGLNNVTSVMCKHRL